MINRIKCKFSELKLNMKIRLFFIILLLLFGTVFLMLFTTMVKYNTEYNRIVQSATTASSFSIDFKSNFDYVMYRIIIGSQPFEEADPYKDIKQAQTIAGELKNAARTKGNRDRAEGIQEYLNNLWRHVNKIEENLQETGHYDENITILENDIKVVTSLIQDTVLEYIYYETLEMESVRAEMEVQMVNNMQFSIIIMGVMFAGALFISVIISNSISRPIKELSSTTNQVARGDLSVRSHITGGAEVKVLSDSLNIMIEKLSNLIETVKLEQYNLREAELKLLQEQINPHFLYNTLDTIIWLAESGKLEEVVGMVSSLSQYFRTSLSKGSNMITLRDEELHVRSYLQIQHLRYEDILDYEINIPEEIGQFYIPKITLQPLVENALYHGIKSKRARGKILVIGRKDGNNVLLTVTDTGMGMKEERLSQVMEGLKSRDEKQKDFYGLYNVNERLHLYYGPEYGISIRSIYQAGTEIEIRIPAREVRLS